MQLPRRSFALGALAFAAAPGGAWAQAGDEMTIGAAGARVHLVEYASMTCPHCAEFHEANWAQLKAAYVDTGRVRYTMREMATPPAPVSLGMFQLARCGGADAPEYFRRLAILFSRQQAILATGTMLGVRDALVAAGGEWGLSQEQVLAALSDQAGIDRITRSMNEAAARGVAQTPHFMINGGTVEAAFMAPGGMARVLDAALARAG